MTRPRSLAKKLVMVGTVGLAMAVFIASPAYADTSQSTASALQISLFGGGLASSGTTTASNDGTTETLTGTQFPTLAVLGGQTVLTAGVLGQVSRAFNDGTSAACAGVLGPNGVITVGPTLNCLVTPDPVVLTLGVVGIATISLQADAIYSNCSATSAPATATGSSTLVNARIVSTVLGIDTPLLSLAASPAPNTGINLPGILSLVLNGQVTGAGTISVNALQLTVLGGSLAGVSIGSVTCGPNAVAPPVPAIPLAGAPIAFGIAAFAVIAGGIVWRRRRLAAVRV
jgi:hypothetical protein